MTSDDLFTVADKKPALSNTPEMSVSDLALSLKQTLEQSYGHIRVRGELAGIKIAASGHLYGDIKDVDANINIVCWRGTLSKLKLKPEDGMDVIITGRVSSYPKSSRYQIIIEKMELAGEGALLKLLEERRKKLSAEGLFDTDRKKPIPFLPEVIGVVTSPTGAVIRDIMHRLKDRFPRHVLLWPVIVQGQGADQQIAKAIEGFNKLDGKKAPKPDVIIVARGGGSLEDLMAFNEENVVRAAANSDIPVISAVGHETDTTLIDYAADLRAPTPTGAAEMAVPMRINLMAQIQDNHERLITSAARIVSDGTNKLATMTAKLGDPAHLLEVKFQTIDLLGEKLTGNIKHRIQSKKSALQETGAKIINPKHLVEQKSQLIGHLTSQLIKSMPQKLGEQKAKLSSLERMLSSLSPKGVLDRGYALVYDGAGNLVRETKSLTDGQDIRIEFANNDKIAAKAGKRLKT